MDKQTLKALQGSIRKWEIIVNETGTDEGAKNCPLCILFINFIKHDCRGCPVSKRTRTNFCRATPYSEWIQHHLEEIDHRTGYKVNCPECRELAKKELKFLQGLLPRRKAKMRNSAGC